MRGGSDTSCGVLHPRAAVNRQTANATTELAFERLMALLPCARFTRGMHVLLCFACCDVSPDLELRAADAVLGLSKESTIGALYASKEIRTSRRLSTASWL